MSKFRCPKCNKAVMGRMLEVAHRCPADKNKIVTFKKEEDVLPGT